MAGSKWTKSQDGPLFLLPERVKLTVNSKKQISGSKWAKREDGPRVKMVQELRSTTVAYPLKE